MINQAHNTGSYVSTFNTGHGYRYTENFWLQCFSTCYVHICAEKVQISGNRQLFQLTINICEVYKYIWEILVILQFSYKGSKCVICFIQDDPVRSVLQFTQWHNIRRICVHIIFNSVCIEYISGRANNPEYSYKFTSIYTAM